VRKNHAASPLLLCLVLAALTGCAHLKGVVTEPSSDRPMRSAVFTIGRPNGIAVYERHTVKADGSFDFYVLPTDEEELFLFDGLADPDLTMRRVSPSEFSEKMRLYLRPAPRNVGPGALDVPANLP